jgi:hypothetical protein
MQVTAERSLAREQIGQASSLDSSTLACVSRPELLAEPDVGTADSVCIIVFGELVPGPALSSTCSLGGSPLGSEASLKAWNDAD